MKIDYFLQDSFYDGKNLYLVFFKDFYYNYAIGIKEGLYKLTLFEAKIEHLDPILNDGEKFNLEIIEKGNYSELLLFDEKGIQSKIKCDKIKEEVFTDTKDDLILMIQDLDKWLMEYQIDLFKKNDFINEIQTLFKKQVEKSKIVLQKGDWISEHKKIEENVKIEVYNQILNLIETFKQSTTESSSIT